MCICELCQGAFCNKAQTAATSVSSLAASVTCSSRATLAVTQLGLVYLD